MSSNSSSSSHGGDPLMLPLSGLLTRSGRQRPTAAAVGGPFPHRPPPTSLADRFLLTQQAPDTHVLTIGGRGTGFPIVNGFNPSVVHGDGTCRRVEDLGDGISVVLDFPGVDRQSLSYSVNAAEFWAIFLGYETISGSGRVYQVKILLPMGEVRMEEMVHEINNGVLTVYFPKV